MAVCPRVRDDFFLVQALQVIQCLLGREAADPAGVALQAGQVVEERGIFGLFFACDFQNVCRAFCLAGLEQFFGFASVLEATACYGTSRKFELHCKKCLRTESADCCIPHDDQGKGRRHDAPHIQGLLIQA